LRVFEKLQHGLSDRKKNGTTEHAEHADGSGALGG
jgi:hypothetical protein